MQEHADAHMALYEEHGDPRDLCAKYMILGFDEEANKIFASMGGKAAHANRIKNGTEHHIKLLSPEEHSRMASMGGKIGGAKCKEFGLGIHAQTPEEHLAIASMGGKANSEKNDWGSSAKQSDRGKRGGVKNKGFKWYTDGISSFKYTVAQQQEQPFEEFIEQHGFRAGTVPRYIPEACPHCGDDKILFMNRRRHFDNCRYPAKEGHLH
jgi:hypothetical protein